MNLIKNVGDRLLGLFLPEVTAQARCEYAFTYCRCTGGHVYNWNWNCTACTYTSKTCC